MSNFVKLAADAGDEYLSLLANGQEQFLKFVTPSAAWVPGGSAPQTAGAIFPTPREIAEANFAFAAKFLKQQKAFTEKLFAATTPAS
jgi:hypothetical protein